MLNCVLDIPFVEKAITIYVTIIYMKCLLLRINLYQ